MGTIGRGRWGGEKDLPVADGKVVSNGDDVDAVRQRALAANIFLRRRGKGRRDWVFGRAVWWLLVKGTPWKAADAARRTLISLSNTTAVSSARARSSMKGLMMAGSKARAKALRERANKTTTTKKKMRQGWDPKQQLHLGKPAHVAAGVTDVGADRARAAEHVVLQRAEHHRDHWVVGGTDKEGVG